MNNIHNACARLARHTNIVAANGAASVEEFSERIAKFFDEVPAANAIEFEVVIDAHVETFDGYAAIHRDGSTSISRHHLFF